MFGIEFAKGAGNSPVFGHFSFGPNGGANPVIAGAASTLVGGASRYIASIVYSGTGIYTVTFIPDAFSAGTAYKFYVGGHPDTLANWFHSQQMGAYDPVARTLVLQTHRAGVAYAPAAGATVRINVIFVTNDSGAP